MSNAEKKSQRAWLGVFLVLFGGYFLFRNLDLIPDFIPYYVFGWEMILILVGVSMLVTRRKEGIIFLGIGVLFLLPDIFYLPYFSLRDWWPLILIVLGAVIILRRRDAMMSRDELNDDYLEDTAIFGGSEKSFTSQSFQGGKVTSVFGGSNINFSQAQLGQPEVVLDVFCLFGGNAFVVPNDWTIINEAFVLFGGYSDNRSSTEPKDPNKVLRIKGSVIFGGSEVKGA